MGRARAKGSGPFPKTLSRSHPKRKKLTHLLLFALRLAPRCGLITILPFSLWEAKRLLKTSRVRRSFGEPVLLRFTIAQCQCLSRVLLRSRENSPGSTPPGARLPLHPCGRQPDSGPPACLCINIAGLQQVWQTHLGSPRHTRNRLGGGCLCSCVCVNRCASWQGSLL